MERFTVFILFLIAGWCCGADWTPDPKLWSLKYFPEPLTEIPEEKAYSARIFKDQKIGDILEVGPWYAGRWSFRYEHKDKLPFTRGTVTGMYKTDGLINNSCSVIIQFYKGGKRLAKRPYPLEKAEDWTEFRITVRCPPPSAQTMQICVGLNAHTAGKAQFSRIQVDRKWEPPVYPETPDEITRPKPPKRLKEGKYYSLHEDNGTWWFADPDGKPFYSLGVDGMTWLPNNQEGLKKGLENAKRASDAGFNTGGGWTSIYAWSKVNQELVRKDRPVFPVFRCLVAKSFKGDFEAMNYAFSRVKSSDDHAMPDPFDPGYEKALRERVRKQLSQGGDQPWMMGWFVDNEVILGDLHRRVWSTHCSKALIAYLENKYQSIRKLNKSWGSSYTSFEELHKTKPDPFERKGSMFGDFWEFRKQIIRQWVKVALKVIHEEDSGRLVFCNRFARGAEEDWEDLIELFSPFDGISTNLYPWNHEAGFSRNETGYLKKLHEKTGKPVIITEWSVPAMDSGLYSSESGLDWSFDKVVKNQTERARQAAQVTIDMYNLPFVVGSHWFIWNDIDTRKRKANRGLVRTDGEFWKELVNSLKKAHERIAEHQILP